jgi:hypothetical protein
MKIISFLTDWAVVDRIINHLQLTFVADRPPPPQTAYPRGAADFRRLGVSRGPFQGLQGRYPQHLAGREDGPFLDPGSLENVQDRLSKSPIPDGPGNVCWVDARFLEKYRTGK